ncbi:hypothetical protein Hdeb2414_s0010g00336051 [Helianthus debilis subsp. tardiflorus]
MISFGSTLNRVGRQEVVMAVRIEKSASYARYVVSGCCSDIGIKHQFHKGSRL